MMIWGAILCGILVAEKAEKVLCSTTLVPTQVGRLCPQRRATFYCTTSGNELIWRMENSNLFTFGSGSRIVQGNTSARYSVLLSDNNGVRRSDLIFMKIPASTFSLTCFDGSSAGLETIRVEIWSAPSRPIGLKAPVILGMFLNVSWSFTDLFDHFRVLCGEYEARTKEMSVIVPMEECRGNYTVAVYAVNVCGQESSPAINDQVEMPMPDIMENTTETSGSMTTDVSSTFTPTVTSSNGSDLVQSGGVDASVGSVVLFVLSGVVLAIALIIFIMFIVLSKKKCSKGNPPSYHDPLDKYRYPPKRDPDDHVYHSDNDPRDSDAHMYHSDYAPEDPDDGYDALSLNEGVPPGNKKQCQSSYN